MGRLSCLLAAGLIAAAVASPATAASDGPTPFGYVKGYLFQSLSDPYVMERVGTRLQLGLEGGGGWAGYHLSVDLDLGTRVGGEPETELFGLRPVEAWFELLGEHLELRVGKQFVFWGRATWVNPTDVITAWDYANMSSELEDYRLAPTAARLRWLISGELELDVVWVPIFEPSRVPLVLPEIEGATVELGFQSVPDRRLFDGEFGLRLGQTVSEWAFDWSLSAYQGWEKLPRASLAPSGAYLPPSPPTRWDYHTAHRRMSMLGLDLAKTLGPLVITAEGAMKFVDGPADLYNGITDRFEYVAGLTWVVSQDMQVGLQNLGKLQVGDPPSDEMFPSPDPMDQQLSLFIQADLAKEWGAQLILIYDLTYSDGFALGFLTWNPIDALNLALGVIGFAGREDTTPYGRMRDASQLFLEAKYSF
ncbi:MAG: hypothetical protein P1V51_07280 [Deltaproteobacteria bacterium]|nr:hypothetical protein [Deltaproteobacteria bacterium]